MPQLTVQVAPRAPHAAGVTQDEAVDVPRSHGHRVLELKSEEFVPVIIIVIVIIIIVTIIVVVVAVVVIIVILIIIIIIIISPWLTDQHLPEMSRYQPAFYLRGTTWLI